MGDRHGCRGIDTRNRSIRSARRGSQQNRHKKTNYRSRERGKAARRRRPFSNRTASGSSPMRRMQLLCGLLRGRERRWPVIFALIWTASGREIISPYWHISE